MKKRDKMINVNLKSLKNYLLIAFVPALISWLALPQDNVFYKIIDALFCAGLAVLCIGGLGFAAYLGGFDLFAYTTRKLSKYSRKNIDNPDIEDVGSYHEYIGNKRRSKGFVLPLTIGGALLMLSFVLTIFC